MLGMPGPISVPGRMGLFGEGTVEAGLSVSPTLVCGERGMTVLTPFDHTSRMVKGDCTAAGREAWPRWPM